MPSKNNNLERNWTQAGPPKVGWNLAGPGYEALSSIWVCRGCCVTGVLTELSAPKGFGFLVNQCITANLIR